MAEDALIMVCTSCGNIELVTSPNDGDAWTDITSTVQRHQTFNRRCQGAQHWVGTSLEECPFPFAAGDGTVN